MSAGKIWTDGLIYLPNMSQNIPDHQVTSLQLGELGKKICCILLQLGFAILSRQIFDHNIMWGGVVTRETSLRGM